MTILPRGGLQHVEAIGILLPCCAEACICHANDVDTRLAEKPAEDRLAPGVASLVPRGCSLDIWPESAHIHESERDAQAA